MNQGFIPPPLLDTVPVSSSRPESIVEEAFSMEVNQRRPMAKVESPTTTVSDEAALRKREAFVSLAEEMERLAEARDPQQSRGGTICTQIA